MKEKDVKVGMLVVPHSKMVDAMTIEVSVVYTRAKSRNQNTYM